MKHYLILLFIAFLSACNSSHENVLDTTIDQKQYIPFADRENKSFSVIHGYVNITKRIKKPILKIGKASFILPIKIIKTTDYVCGSSEIRYGNYTDSCNADCRVHVCSSGGGAYTVSVDSDREYLYLTYLGYEFNVCKKDGNVLYHFNAKPMNIYIENMVDLHD
jgi:hypothetical protein